MQDTAPDDQGPHLLNLLNKYAEVRFRVEGVYMENVAYLCDWWIGHILEEDKEYAEDITS